MQRRILGLDPGLAILGFGIIDYDPAAVRDVSPTLEVVDFGIIETPAKTDLGSRLSTLYSDLTTIIDTYQPDTVAIEKLFFYRMGNTILVAQARGVVMLALGQHELLPLEFTPAQIKQALTGYGNASKREVQEAVARELKLETIPRPDDAADALAVAVTGWFNLP